ncbi:hypothetical protein [Roseococcus thiosulfatophilus]|uniref:hypothetical protein n=1 Tax=Roseococcus thiosulfatophilus TaxID=35813 RepID=UPI001A8F8248|nr:hypothetical protein [Roseococcus thiosulfatophilus]
MTEPFFLLFTRRPTGQGLRWWHHLLDARCAHVVVVQPMVVGSLVVQPFGKVLKVEWSYHPAEDQARGLMWAWNARALRVPAPPEQEAPPELRPFMTCVEVAKAMLGLSAWWIVTPRQLWWALVARGARVVPRFVWPERERIA